MGVKMTTGEILFVAMAVGAFVLFCGVLYRVEKLTMSKD